MSSASRVAHLGLPFANPLSEAAVDQAISALPLPGSGCVLETGCGGGEILRRALRAHPGTRGIGIDTDPDAIADARALSGDLPVRWAVQDAGSVEGRFEAVINVGASHAHGGFPKALDALRALAPVALYGEGFWRHPPSEDFLSALGGATADELSNLEGLHAAVTNRGFEVLHESLTTETDWANYEERLASNAEHAATSESLVYAKRIRDRRSLPDGVDTLGFALMILHV